LRELLPNTVVIVYRPVEALNLGVTIDPASDLAIEISWSGTTDSLLKVDAWLSDAGVMRLGITGKPQSDLGRRTANSGGTLDVRSGVEISVATVKGYQAVLMTLNLLALQLAKMRPGSYPKSRIANLLDELTLIIPRHVRRLLTSQKRRERIRQVARRCRNFNKVAVIGGNPVEVEAELKIEELGQIVACSMEYHAASLRLLIERSAEGTEDCSRTLFILNATSSQARLGVDPVLRYLQELGVFCIVHTCDHQGIEAWQSMSNTEVFISPQATTFLQPLIDAPFFFDLAVALAYERGLTPEEIDRPRNLAKSVTTTAAEPRAEVEARIQNHSEFKNVSLPEFGSGLAKGISETSFPSGYSHPALRITSALRAALAGVSRPLPPELPFGHAEHLIVLTDTEATENGANMSALAWQELLNLDLVVYRRFLNELPSVPPDTALLKLVRAGGVPAVCGPSTLALPSDMPPFQLELLSAVYLTSLAIRLARQRGVETRLWEAGLVQMPRLNAEMLEDFRLSAAVNAALRPLIVAGYDKAQIIGGGQDYSGAKSIARSLRMRGFMAEAEYTDSAWHGPLATVGGPDADHDTLIVILATDPLFQSAALVDTQVYRARHAYVLLIVPEGNQDMPAIIGIQPSVVLPVPAAPRPFTPLVNAVFGEVMAREMSRLWEKIQRKQKNGGNRSVKRRYPRQRR
jgi:glucosamine 6-phosphate synthetase-like amidotransferase/phosphosugar isomerase protein